MTLLETRDIPLMLAILRRVYGKAHCALYHESPLQLLVATILSAQCTDARVNKVTPVLFQKYRTAEDFSQASQGELEKVIKTTGFFRNKAKSIRGMAKIVVEKHAGKIPDTMEALLELPGVARKTANVVLGNAFEKAVGVVVDTHVARLSARLGLSHEKTPEKIEKDLMGKIPGEKWIWFSHALILHGRAVCKARRPECARCPLKTLCPNPPAL